MSFTLLSYWVSVENFIKRHFVLSKPRPQEVPKTYESLKENLEAAYLKMPSPKFWSQTSGTRMEPKKIPYNRQRIKLIQSSYTKAMMTLLSCYPGKKTFFVFASLDKDQSLTSGLLDEGSRPPLMALLQAPYRYLHTKEGRNLREAYGTLTARVALLLVAQPRFLYATNPSTLVHFLGEFKDKEEEIKRNISLLLQDKRHLLPLLQLSEGRAKERLEDFCKNPSTPVQDFLKNVKGIVSWDGGYVRVFLEQLRSALPHVEMIPMFSMSTEGLQTLPHRVNGKIYFLPLIPKTTVEFLSQEKVLQRHELKEGDVYTMLLTDNWGLQRYDTQDLFQVRKMINGWPDLAFLKRRGMNSSLTGEKLTEEQVLILYQNLRQKFPPLKDTFMAIHPCKHHQQIGYRLVLLSDQPQDLILIQTCAEASLSEINSEYASKVSSGRLLSLEVKVMKIDEFASVLGRQNRWESQFKLLPLYEGIVEEK